ncbi:undecaprenyl-phosphate glucose phosphotransferase [Sinimarinibacterium thermocellulolyticum]|uniref:Undecaprenyl-phosphate glucose phosphotransferase n=1 Tax=Sinimarinibacterium thermocellulolyticum TaxID=3170016 RepID=A0ABV2ACG5_9GAMM
MAKARVAAPFVQGLVYAGVAAGLLYAITMAYSGQFTTPYRIVSALAAAFSFLVLGRIDLLARWRMGRPGSVGTRLLYHWTAIFALLLFLGYVTQTTAYFSRVILTAWFVMTPAVLAVINVLARAFTARFVPDAVGQRRAVIVFASDSAQVLARSLRESELYHLEGFFDDRSDQRLGRSARIGRRLGHLRDLVPYVRDHAVDVVFIMLPEQGIGRVTELIDALGDTTASVYCVPDYSLLDLIGAEFSEIEGVPVLRVAETPLFGVDGVYKYVFDITVSTLGLMLLAPVMLLIAIAIRLDSPGPVIFRQARYGLNGRRFDVYKFRTMRINDPDGCIVQVSRHDPRVTRIGRFLRRTSLDELPQLVNVLKGDMSLVGPRPHAVQHNEYYRKAVKRYMLRHKVKPGITGWAQINGLRGNTDELAHMEERVRYDLEYIRRWSPLFDIEIILKTLLLVIRDRNAY